MSEVDIAAMRRDFDLFRQEMGKMHADNRVDREKDRSEFKALIDQARDQFQVSVNQTFAQFQAVQHTAIRNQTLLEFAIGDGSQGSGRIGVLEKSIEQLKQFRWQALAVAAVGLWLLDKLVGHK